jgi:hypothetical protein
MFKDSSLDPSVYLPGATTIRDYATGLEGRQSFVRRSNLRSDSPPTPSDDANAGYRRGSVWLQDYQQTQIVWMCMDSTPGDAQWAAFAYGQPALTFPFDMGFVADQILFFMYDLGSVGYN